MPRIHVLPSELVNQIAAGEVVERPASVVKELVENALDAEARTIEIVLEQGGRRLIEVSDDGIGMAEQDARLALERHATSKIRIFDDLTRVATLGFRGEALPSIASVSRLRLTTFDGKEQHGVEIEPGRDGGAAGRPAARERGTTVRVEGLFENVPARRKFLRSADAEFRAAVTVVSSYALPSPERSFRLTHNGRVVLDLPAAGSSRERVLQILGAESGKGLAEIESDSPSCRARGFVTRGIRFGSRRNQFFFVNGRLVRDRVLTHAATRAAEAFDFDGHPAIVLFLEIDGAAVDVNVHPAKTEVRFRDGGAVHVVVEQAVRRALGFAEEGGALLGVSAVAEGPQRAFEAHSGGARPAQVPLAGTAVAPPPREVLHEATPLFQTRPLVQPPRESGFQPAQGGEAREPALSLGDLQGRVIGQYRMSYILCDIPGGLRLIDQHVAHERVLYDRLEAVAEQGGGATQRLLTPYLHEAGGAEAALLDSLLGELRGVGFEIERFSGGSFAVTAVPALLRIDSLGGFFRKLLDAATGERGSHLDALRERMLASLACQAAIKVHRPLGGEEMALLAGDLLSSSNPYACPHGRPIIVDIRHADVERHFHRR